MKFSEFTRKTLKCRRFARLAKAEGFQLMEGPWQILRGGDWQKVITEVRIDPGGKHVWVKTGAPKD